MAQYKSFGELPLQVQRALTRAAAEVKKAKEDTDRATATFAAACEAAVRAGMSKSTIGRMVGMSRQAIQQRMR